MKYNIPKILFIILFCVIFIATPSITFSLTPFFFDSYAFAVDENDDGGDEYILVSFDIDLDEEVIADITINAKLYNNANNIVDAKTQIYKIIGQQPGYNEIKLFPIPNIADTYSVLLSITDSSYTSYIPSILYNPVSGSQPIPYFADIIVKSEFDGIVVDIDANIIQEITSDVKVDIILNSSNGIIIRSETLSYKTFYENIDYRRLTFAPPKDDLYMLAFLIYPQGSGTPTDTRLINVLYPPGTGAYFDEYNATIINDSVLVYFDVDLYYNVNELVSVEAILYDSSNDPVAYNYISYFTYGKKNDQKSITLAPNQVYGDIYYVELIVHTAGYPSSYEYITDLKMGSFIIDARAGPNGSIKPLGKVNAKYGYGQAFTITQSKGYHILDVKVNGKSKGAIDSYEFKSVESNQSIEASFSIDKYNIIVKSGDGGSISPSETVTLDYGTSQKFTITPSKGYHILDVKVNGESKGAIDSYEFKSVESNQSIEASFSIDKYNIIVKSGDGGSISPSETVTLDYGTSQKFTITPSKGYHILDVKVNGESKGAIDSYEFKSVESNQSIEASFDITCIKGDVNSDGLVKSDDALMLLKYIVKLIELSDCQKISADIDINGNIDTKDVIIILQKSSELMSPPNNYYGQVSFIIPEIYGVSGKSVNMPLKIGNADRVACGYICIAYDSNVLKATEIVSKHEMIIASNINDSGMIYIAFAFNDKPKSEILSSIKFDVIADEVSLLKIADAEIYDANTSPLSIKKLDGIFFSWAKPAEKDALLQNFPNPFNPETWIPYQLKYDSDVSICIYNQTGNLVKEFNLGHKPAGTYITIDRAVYWDGKNSLGEKVASGVYFYSIKAGKFTNTRKMIILE